MKKVKNTSMLVATILVFGSHQVVGDFSLLYWIGIQACMCNDVPCAQVCSGFPFEQPHPFVLEHCGLR
jgi:hypothetical protein